jgi:mono/diheme cytochrome c family protein
VRLRGWMMSALVAVPVVACGRDEPDVRVPLGANMIATRRPMLAPPTGAPGERTVISATASLPPATYTAEQAERGATVYLATCARCHPPGQLDGENFAAGWHTARASALFSTLRNTMPQDKPGSLTDAEYADVLAYMLQRNRVSAGTIALTTDTTSLRQLRIDLPTTP